MKKIVLIFLLPITLYSQCKYELPANSQLLDKSMQIAIAQVGTIEKSNRNDGAVEKYWRAVGLTAPSPYCAAGVYFCFAEGCKQLNLPISHIPIPRTGLAQAIYNYAKSNGKKQIYKAKIHNLIVWRKGQTTFGHIERIINVQEAGWVHTVAFNVKNEATGKEGVFIKKRNIYHPISRLKVLGLVGFNAID
ncbi:MAG TPA: hypothetical protein PKV40_06115 [Candidatus Kapabacteria bacterium]|nr:hypothetical protein [Candidatus Kapabacteria bacterium]